MWQCEESNAGNLPKSPVSQSLKARELKRGSNTQSRNHCHNTSTSILVKEIECRLKNLFCTLIFCATHLSHLLPQGAGRRGDDKDEASAGFLAFVRTSSFSHLFINSVWSLLPPEWLPALSDSATPYGGKWSKWRGTATFITIIIKVCLLQGVCIRPCHLAVLLFHEHGIY